MQKVKILELKNLNNQSDVLCGLSNRQRGTGPVYDMKTRIASNQTDGYEADG